LEVRPVIWPVKVPVPPPSVVLASAMVGFCVVFQHKPRAVTGAPPSEVTLHGQLAVVVVISVTWPVEISGALFSEDGFSCGPQEKRRKPASIRVMDFFMSTVYVKMENLNVLQIYTITSEPGILPDFFITEYYKIVKKSYNVRIF
jgi:hypothetical protein